MTDTMRPTRREERRAQTVREIKQLAMDQVSAGGPDAVSLSGIVREMSMSPAAVYRYFTNRDALLADLVVDSYSDLADALAAIERGAGSPADHLGAVLRGMRAWALQHPNPYRLIFQTSIGSGENFAADRLIPAASRSMSVLIEALAEAGARNGDELAERVRPITAASVAAMTGWAERTGLTSVPVEVLMLGLLTWTRLHGIISLELGGHLAATGVGADVLFDAEVETITHRAQSLPMLPSLP